MKEIYVSMSGAVASEKYLAIVANNLANVNSVGFKKDTAVFEVRPPEVDFEAMVKSADPDLGLPVPRQQVEGNRNFVRVAGSYTDFSVGPLRATNGPLDVAIEEPEAAGTAAFFAVETAEGTRYTRMGNFQRNSANELVTPSGFRVLGANGGPIRLGSMSVDISKTGAIASDGEDVGSFDVVVFDNPQFLEKTGYGLFSDPDGRAGGRAALEADGVSVRQGYLEMANVNVVEELVKMIEIQRMYTTFQKSLQTMDDASSKAIASVLNA